MSWVGRGKPGLGAGDDASLLGSDGAAAGTVLTADGAGGTDWLAVALGLNWKGTWDASLNNPALASGVGTNGDYYRVSVAGTTNLDGITDWQVGDHLSFDGTSWQKIDNTDQVSSVNGQTGAVTVGTVYELTTQLDLASTTGIDGDIALVDNLARSFIWIGGDWRHLGHLQGQAYPAGGIKVSTFGVNTTLATTDTWVILNPTASGLTVTLPDISEYDAAARMLYLRNDGSFPVTIDPDFGGNGYELDFGSATPSAVLSPGEATLLIGDGGAGNWSTFGGSNNPVTATGITYVPAIEDDWLGAPTSLALNVALDELGGGDRYREAATFAALSLVGAGDGASGDIGVVTDTSDVYVNSGHPTYDWNRIGNLGNFDEGAFLGVTSSGSLISKLSFIDKGSASTIFLNPNAAGYVLDMPGLGGKEGRLFKFTNVSGNSITIDVDPVAAPTGADIQFASGETSSTMLIKPNETVEILASPTALRWYVFFADGTSDMQTVTATAQTIATRKASTYVEVSLAANGTINLPSLGDVNSGARITVQKAGAGNVQVTPFGADTINGGGAYVLDGDFETVTVIAGSDWRIE